jgi:hypothetical protein
MNEEIGSSKPFFVFAHGSQIAIYVASTWSPQVITVASVFYPENSDQLGSCTPSNGQGESYPAGPPINPGWIYPFSLQ